MVVKKERPIREGGRNFLHEEALRPHIEKKENAKRKAIPACAPKGSAELGKKDGRPASTKD